MFITILPKTNFMYSAVIIDDEEDGINVLKQLLKNFTSLNIKVAGVATNLKQGVQLIKQNEPEIVFLDIDMPNENGIAIFNYFESPAFKVIFVTAHKQYAIDALNHSATGYLLKPVSIIDLQEILKKTIKQLKTEQQHRDLEENFNVLHAANIDDQTIMLDTQNGFIMENTKNIEYCYANQSYSVVVLHTKKEIIFSKPLKNLEEILPEKQFYRTHKSYLVNISFISKFIKGNENYLILKSGAKIPVSVRNSKIIANDIRKMLVN